MATEDKASKILEAKSNYNADQVKILNSALVAAQMLLDKRKDRYLAEIALIEAENPDLPPAPPPAPPPAKPCVAPVFEDDGFDSAALTLAIKGLTNVGPRAAATVAGRESEPAGKSLAGSTPAVEPAPGADARPDPSALYAGRNPASIGRSPRGPRWGEPASAPFGDSAPGAGSPGTAGTDAPTTAASVGEPAEPSGVGRTGPEPELSARQPDAGRT